MNKSDVAVVGGGIAGLVCARELSRAGLGVDVFDKGRSPSGRIASRRRGEERFDHGAQFFTVRDVRFRRIADELQSQGVIAQWDGRFGRANDDGRIVAEQAEPRWVGTPTMSAAARALATGLSVNNGVDVARVERHGAAWRLWSSNSGLLGTYPRVVVAVPAPQAAPLLRDTSLHGAVRNVRMAPCWTLMMTCTAPFPISFDAVRWSSGPVRWLAREASKPGRESGARYVVQASPEFSRRFLEAHPDLVIRLLEAELERMFGPLPVRVRVSAHRWRHAMVERPGSQEALFDRDRAIGACGDWCIAPRVEAAALSGLAMATRLLEAMAPFERSA